MKSVNDSLYAKVQQLCMPKVAILVGPEVFSKSMNSVRFLVSSRVVISVCNNIKY